MRRQKDPRHTFARWIMELEELHYRIEYRSGMENHMADYLSRSLELEYDEEVNKESEFEDRVYYTCKPSGPQTNMEEMQRKDSTIQNLLK